MIVIIGAGITGLFLGHTLLKCGFTDFRILEENNRAGGKIYTDYTTNGTIELGPSIIHSNQKHMMDILQDLGLTFKPITHQKPKLYVGVPLSVDPLPFFSLSKYAPVSKVLTKEQKLHREDYNEIRDMNYKWWRIGEDNEGDIGIIKEGWGEMAQRLYIELLGYMCMPFKVKTIDVKHKLINDTLPFTQVVICTGFNAAKKIKWRGVSKKVLAFRHAAKPVSSLRIYVEWKNVVPEHLKSYSHIISNKDFRWFIDINDKISLISYTDGRRANKLKKMGRRKAVIHVLKELGLSPAAITSSWVSGSNDAIVNLKPNLKREWLKNMHKVIPNKVYQTCLPFPTQQAWTEGHLIQAAKVAEELLDLYHKKC